MTGVVETTHDWLRRFRHDLRTPLNHILGYGELLIEEAEDAGAHSLLAPLRSLQAAGKDALAHLDHHLSPTAPRPESLARLTDALAGPLGQIDAALAAICGDDAGEIATDDVEKIASAVAQLRALMQGGGAPASVAGNVDAGRYNGADSVGREESSVLSDTGTGAILVVDDDAGNRDVLARRLERLGYAIGYAENGLRALDRLAGDRFDLVLLDVMMPELDGYETLRRMKADERLRDIPVIVISALDELASVVRCIEMGAEDYLAKPFDPVLLRARIGASLEKKRLRDLEVEYLRQVARVTAAAAAVEAGEFDAASLVEVAAREDALGQLARVFERMAREVQAREQRLRQQVQELTIEVDRARADRQVSEITETDYFRSLQERARGLRARTGTARSARQS